MSRTNGRRGRTAAIVGSVALAVGAAAAATVGLGGSGGGTPAAADLPPGTAQVTRQTMRDTDDVDGDLGYGDVATLAGRLSGTVTWLPAEGTVITRGKPVYRVDNDPVVLMYGSLPAYRSLGPGDEGADVAQLERNLKALGYAGFTADDEYTWATADAVEEWQEDLGVAETGRVEQGRIAFAAGAVRVDGVKAEKGQQTGGGQEVLTYTGTTRRVTVRLDVGDQRLARKGAAVRVELPDGKTVAGRVERVYTVVEEPDDPGGDAETKIEAVVSLRDPKAAAGLEAAVVTVVFTAAERKNVLTVPVAALVALAEGGYGVEVVDGSTSRYVRVETGLFAGGQVEITGDGIAEGMTVGMPK